MKRSLFAALFVAVTLVLSFVRTPYAQEESRDAAEEASITEATPEEDILAERKTVHGKGGRRRFRARRWAVLLKGDMKEVYETYGYPSTRYREETLGRVIEKWIYLGVGKEFTFREGQLIKKRNVTPGSFR